MKYSARPPGPKCFTRLLGVVFVGGILGLCACSGEIGRNGGSLVPTSGENGPAVGAPASKPSAGAALQPGAAQPGGLPFPESGAACTDAGKALSPLRRLTNLEYDNTVRDLFPGLDVGRPSSTHAFVGDSVEHLFDNEVGHQAVERDRARGYLEAAEAIAAKALADIPRLLGCDPASKGEDACVEQFIGTFGERAFRRPLESVERDRLGNFYAGTKATAGFATGVQALVERMLQSPQFLYRVELTSTTSGGAKMVRVDPWELATRLSYLFRASMPDTELFEAARSGRLRETGELERQARRLLADARSWDSLGHFARQWLGLDKLSGDPPAKDPQLFPRWGAEVKDAMRAETEAFFKHVLGAPGVRYEDLFAGNYTFANRVLANHYGIEGPAGETPVKVALDPRRSAGLLTQGSYLVWTADPQSPNAIFRGKYIRERLLCAPVPEPTVNIPDLSEPKPTVTSRQRVEEHSKNPCAQACHRLLDPIGFALENFDAVGVWRDRDAGQTVDASGELFGEDLGDTQGRFDGVAELGRKMAGSQHVRSCIAEQMFRFAFGRGPVLADGASPGRGIDQCTMETLRRKLGERGSLSDMLVALVTTEAFLHRPATGGN